MDATSKKTNVKKILMIALNVFFYLVILLLLFFAIANMKVKAITDIPNIFGTGYLSVDSDSMTGENKDSFNEGDLIIVKMLNDKRREKLVVGDIITFYDSKLKALNTHRIVHIIKQNDGTYVVTQGDKTAAIPSRKYSLDPDVINDENDYEIIKLEDALAVHTGTWSKAGKTFSYISSPAGFALVIVLPTALFLFFEAFLLIKNILAINNKKMEDKYGNAEDLQDLAAAKELMRQQILEEIKQEQENQK